MQSLTAPADPLRVACDARCLADGEVRGFARYTIELLSALRRRDDVEVFLVTDTPLELPPPLVGLDIRTIASGREWQREQRNLPRLVAEAGGDVLFSPANRGLPLVGGPSVLTLHDAVEWDDDYVSRPRGRDRVRFGYASVASLLAATRIITVSRHAATELAARLGLGDDRVRVVLEAAAPHFLEECSGPERAAARSALELPDEYVLYLGGFDEKKSVETLVRAWARRDPDRTPPLVLAGKSAGGETQYLRDLAVDLGADPDRMHFVGYVPDEMVRAVYAEATLFVFPAVAEGFGLPAVEAMACGTPTVVADAASLPEATRGAAVRFPPDDDRALGLVIDRLLGDDDARLRLGQIGRDAMGVRTWDDVAADTAVVLREAASTSAPSRLARSVAAGRHVHRWVR